MRKLRNLNLQEKVGDMTSMIDVVFLLLIFFILMPFKTSESRIESHLPKNSGTSPEPSKEKIVEKIDIKIKVNKEVAMNIRNYEGVTVTINGKKLSSFISLNSRLADLRANLKGDLSTIPLELNADENVPFYFVVKALDFAKLNNFSFIKFPQKPVLASGQFPRLNTKGY